MNCTNCMGYVDRVGYDIHSDDDNMYEEIQYECLTCGSIGSKVIKNGEEVKYYGLTQPKEREI